MYSYERMYAIVGRKDENNYVAWDSVNNQFEIINYENICEQSYCRLYNAYINTVKQRLVGFNVDIDRLPILQDGVLANYYVFVANVDAGKLFVQPYGECTSLSIDRYEKPEKRNSSYTDFIKSTKIYGGCGDTIDYCWRYKLSLSPLEYVTPIHHKYYIDDDEVTLKLLFRNFEAFDYLRLPFGITEFKPYDYFYDTVINELELSKSVIDFDMSGIGRYNPTQVTTLKIPSSVLNIYNVPTIQNGLNGMRIECNPDSKAWSVLTEFGLSTHLCPNSKL